MEHWLVPYLCEAPRRRAPRRGEPAHVLLCIADHYEPGWGNPTPEVARARIRQGARRAIERLSTIPPMRLEGRVELEIDLVTAEMADSAERVPCVTRLAPRTVGYASDDYVELYLEGNAHLKVDFEIGDALDKLERLGLVKKEGEAYRAVPLGKALEVLDWRWDNYFKYNNPEPEAMPRV